MTVIKCESLWSDASLLALETEYLRLEEKMAAETMGPEQDLLFDHCQTLGWRIADTPANTPAGMAVKVRLLMQGVHIGTASWDERLCEGLLADLGRLTQG